MPSALDRDAPYISVVATARNNGRDAGMLKRVQIFVDAWILQAKRHNLPSELIIVEAAEPGGQARLTNALRWPSDTGPCRVRVIEVTQETEVPVGKNAGIRRARGKFILATNIDILFSDELMEFLAARRLESGRVYRIDRHDVTGDVPADATPDEQLAYCRSHVIRLWAREGSYQVTPDGFRENEPVDIARAQSGIHFGNGWFGVEWEESGRPFRWIDDDSEILVRVPSDGAVLDLEVEPGPGIGETPTVLQVLDCNGLNVAEWEITGRTTMKLVLPPAENDNVQTFRLHVPCGGMPVVHDPRILNFRVFLCDWAESGKPAPTPMSTYHAIQVHRPTLMRLLKGLKRFGQLRRAVRLLRTRGDDIFATGIECWLGAGWYELEHSATERFRWVAQDAQLLVRTSGENCKLALLLEPGPGVDFQPFVLLVRRQSGQVLARAPIHGMTYVEVPIPAASGAVVTLFLALKGGGLSTATDPRILNFRVFACGGVEGDASSLPASEPESWTALTVASRPAGIDWNNRLAECRQSIGEMGKQIFLHLNGCGDFTLMAREHWYDVRGYAELDASPMDLDSLLCLSAHYAGLGEETLREPMRIYRLQDGTEEMQNRQEHQYGPATREDLIELIAQMRRLHAPVIFNLDGWGMAESTLASTESAVAASAPGRDR